MSKQRRAFLWTLCLHCKRTGKEKGKEKGKFGKIDEKILQKKREERKSCNWLAKVK